MSSAKFRPFCLGFNVLSIHGFGHAHESAYLVTLIQSMWNIFDFFHWKQMTFMHIYDGNTIYNICYDTPRNDMYGYCGTISNFIGLRIL